MTLLDKALEFSGGQAITTTAFGQNEIDLTPLAPGNTHRDIGSGRPLFVNVYVTEAFLSAGAATLNVVLQTDDNAAFGSPTILFDSGPIPRASLVAGYAFQLPVPRGAEKFLRVQYVVGTGPMTGGRVRSYIADSWQDARTYVAATPIVSG